MPAVTLKCQKYEYEFTAYSDIDVDMSAPVKYDEHFEKLQQMYFHENI